MGERCVRNAEVGSSTLLRSTFLTPFRIETYDTFGWSEERPWFSWKGPMHRYRPKGARGPLALSGPGPGGLLLLTGGIRAAPAAGPSARAPNADAPESRTARDEKNRVRRCVPASGTRHRLFLWCDSREPFEKWIAYAFAKDDMSISELGLSQEEMDALIEMVHTIKGVPRWIIEKMPKKPVKRSATKGEAPRNRS